MRIRRSELTTPGSSTKMMKKASESDADEVMLDLEDAVAPNEKEEAREKIVDAIHEFNWSDKLVAVRINDLTHENAYGDLIEVVEGAGEHIDTIIVPKITTGKDVYVVDILLTQIESKVEIDQAIGLEVLIEETKAVQNVDKIAAASNRLEALIFGPADYSASQGVNLQSIGAHTDKGQYPGDVWHYVRNRIVIAAQSNGLAAIDGPFGDFKDTEAYREESVRSATLGFEGKWAIHPDQIEIANEVYAPSEDEIERAQKIVEAMEKGQEKGQGAVQLNGEMLDEASLRNAERRLGRARAMGLID